MSRRTVCLILLQGFMAMRGLAQFDTPNAQSFFQAIVAGNTNKVFSLLNADTNLANARAGVYYGRTPLILAAAQGSAANVDKLLRAGADINAQGDTMLSMNVGLTALEAAIADNHPDVVRLLLDKGADPNIQSHTEGGALHYAFSRHQADLVKLLLDHGANPCLEIARPFRHQTPLDMCVTHTDGRLMPDMLKAANHYFETTAAKAKGSPRRHAGRLADFLGQHGIDLLSAAASRGELEAVEALVKAEVSLKSDKATATTVMREFAVAEAGAAQGQQFDRARWWQIRDLLVKAGADYDAFAATALGDQEQARALSAGDRNLIHAQDATGETLLHWAVRNDRPDLTSFWLGAGVSPAATNAAGQTALHIAATLGLAHETELLLAAHAPAGARDTNGWTPLDAAIKSKQSETIRLLLADKTAPAHLERGHSLPIHEAAAGGNIAVLIALTESTNQLEARNELGLTPFQIAVQNGHLGAAAFLADKGANVNARDPDGNTALHQVLLHPFPYIVWDRPTRNWLARLDHDPQKDLYQHYLTVGEYEQGPESHLQAIALLLACKADLGATNNAGRAPIQLMADDNILEKYPLRDEDRTALLKLLNMNGNGAGINQADASGDTPLHRAAATYNFENGTALIAAGADINATNAQGQTPLHIAAQRIFGWTQDGSFTPLQELVKNKAKVNAQDKDGLTPLHVLARADTMFKPEAMRLLLDAGANPNLRDNHDRTPAHLLFTGRWPWSDAGACLKILAKAGADLSAKDDEGKTPLHYVAALGTQKPLFFIHGLPDAFEQAKVDFNARDHAGDTPMHIAARNGTRDVLDWLAQRGGNLDATNQAGETPRLLAAHSTNTTPGIPPDAKTDLVQAIRDGNLEAATKLLEGDSALANASDKFQLTPLRQAVESRRTNIIELLEKHGVRWDAVSAVEAGRNDVLRRLIQGNPGLVKGPKSAPPLLSLAVDEGNIEIIQTLVSAKYDVQRTDTCGLTALGHALLKKNEQAAALLRENGAAENFIDAVYDGDSELVTARLKQDKALALARTEFGLLPASIAAARGNVDVLKILLSRGASASATNSDGKTPLHYAAIFDQTNTAQLLCRHRVEIEAHDQAGLTPLHWAAMQGSEQMVAFLLQHKADPNAKASATVDISVPFMARRNPILGGTPLHLAVLEGRTNVIALLLKGGADINATNQDGRTPLDVTTGPYPVVVFGILYPFAARTAGMPGYFSPRIQSPPPSAYKNRRATAAMLEAAGGKRTNRPYSPPNSLFRY